MIVLALDTALSSCSASIVKNGAVISELYEDRLRGQAERLIPMCQSVCNDAKVSFDDIQAIAVTIGPGTFTGVRIGLSAAKGLALALNVPLIGVSTLDVVAKNAAQSIEEATVAIALDARRSEVYFQVFELDKGNVSAVSKPSAVALDKVVDMLSKDVSQLIGSGSSLIEPLLPTKILDRINFPHILTRSNAGTLGQIASHRYKEGKVEGEIKPLYLRAPDAVAAKPITYPFQNQ